MQYSYRTQNQFVHIVDDEFSTNVRRAIKIAQIIRKRGLHPQLVYDSRATDLLWDGYVDSMAEFTTQFLVGAECGYDEGLRRIGKGTTCQILEDAACILHKYGISDRADFSFILGLPWETKTEIRRTIRFAMHLFSTYGVRTLLQWYCQIPGSRLWEQARQQDLVNETMYDTYGFFGNLYLFRTGVNLTPKEIWEICELVFELMWIIDLCYPEKKMVEHGFPDPILAYYPRHLLSHHDTGLPSLREVSRPPVEARDS